ncbi:hypothetical protein [Rhabdothermincola salaria]|uniref:hypothetical protein n=1 Tax=Rhabdothermincola salaria TaxID=2903142 RepID=UPI001E558E95|nr:hypothetical protein [Rhabdothermincola salaria]MCD9623759.1 hypothetical protein [Rhabdothermincola salaria]
MADHLRDGTDDTEGAAAGIASDDDAAEARTEFPLDDWSVEDRALLDRLLTGEDIPHAWQGATVVVPRGSQYVVDELIDQVEMAATPGTMAEPAVHDALGSGGEAEGEAGGDPDGDEWDDAEGWDDDVDAQEVLGEAFLAADRLNRRASDPEGVLALVEVHGTMQSMGLPFGFEPAVWDDLVSAVARIAAVLTQEVEPGPGGGEHVEALAEDLRARLRPLV